MLNLKDHFYLITIIFLVLTTTFVGYYFLYTLPKYNQEKLDFDKQKYNEDLSRQDEKSLEEEFLEQNKQASLEQCLNEAKSLRDQKIEYINNTLSKRCEEYKRIGDTSNDYNTKIDNYKLGIGCFNILEENKKDTEDEYLTQKEDCFRLYK